MNFKSLMYLAKLRRNLHLDIDYLHRIQQQKLRAIIRHAYENVPFYNRKFKNAGIKPEDIRSVSDLYKIPMTTKIELQMTALDELVSRTFDINTCIQRTTSGSTGIPLTIVIDKKGEGIEEAVRVRALLENGLRFRDKLAVIGDPRHFPEKRGLSERLHFTSRKRISIFDDMETQLKVLKGYKPDVLNGYTSSLAILAERIKKDESYCIKPHVVFTTAELLENETRSLISSGFETDVLDNYACSEFSLLAWECHEHSGYHINIDNLVMEFLRDGEPVSSMEKGEIVCTGLNNYVMPLLRYSLEDVGVPQMDECSCGATLPLMKTIKGRKDDFLVSIDGDKISPTLFFPYPFENVNNIQQFRIIQEKRDLIIIQVAFKEKGDNSKLFENANLNIKKVFGEEMQVEFQALEKIGYEKKKMRKIISKISVPW